MKLSGTVAFVDPEWRTVFIQDGGQGLYLPMQAGDEGLAAGDEVQLVGRTALDGTAYRVVDRRLHPTGRRSVLEAPRTRVAEMLDAARRQRWAELEGRVLWAMSLDGRLHLGLGEGTNFVLVRILPPNQLDASRLVDAIVRLKGVASPLDDLRTPRMKSQFYCPGDQFLRVVTPPPRDPFQGALQAIHALTTKPSLSRKERVHVQGFVVEQDVGTSLVIRDHTGVAEVETTLPKPFEIGLPVDVAGFPSVSGGRLHLSEAVVRSSGATSQGANPPPSPVADASPGSPTLTNLAGVCGLSATEAARGYPVRLKAVVTRVIPRWQSMFLADESSSIYMSDWGDESRLAACRPGDTVELEAITGRGDFKPILAKPRLLSVSSGHSPPRALRTQVAVLYSGGSDCEMVEVRGIVLSGGVMEGAIQLRLEDNGAPFTAMVPGDTVPTNLVGSTVRLRGVCGGRFDGQGNVLEITVWINSLEDIQIEQSQAAEPLALSALRARVITTPEALHLLNRRVTAEGAVLLVVPGQSVDLLNDGRGLRVLLKQTAGLHRGDRIAVTGFLGMQHNQQVIRNAVYRRLGSGTIPAPQVLSPERLLDASYDAALVEVEASVLGQSGRGGVEVLMLQSAGWVFDAVSTRTGPTPNVQQARPGSVVQVRGVYVLDISPTSPAPSFHIKFDPEHDIKVLTPAPWWTWKYTLGLAGALVAGLAGTLLWIRQLRRRVLAQTEQIRARVEKEAALEHRHRDLVENAGDFIFSTDRDGRLTAANLAGGRLLQCPREQLLQRTMAELVVPEHRQLLEQMLRPTPANESPPAWELDLLRQDGRRLTVELRGRPISEGGRPVGFQGIMRDITERKHLEEQLRQAQKTEAIGHLAGGVAHDFNNLLTVITGHVELLRAETPPDTDTADSLQEVAQAADRAAGLTRQLLAYGRRQRMQARILDLNEVIANFSRMLHRLIGEHILLQCRLGDGLPTVKGDAGMLEQVLMNLVVNARDAMPQGGCIEISTTITDLSPAQARHRLDARPGRFVTLSVRDTGCGMSPQTLDRLFEPFFTTKEVGKGSGLGLPVAEGIVKQHGGWFEVESAPGQGSKFSCFLPAAEQGDPSSTAAPDAHHVRGGCETILVVEDEQLVRQLVSRVLKQHGYHVLEAVSGAEALHVWERQGAEVALLLTDLVMPDGLTGRELAQRLLRQRPDLKVLFSSGYSVDLNDPLFAAQTGGSFLQKPYHPDQLLTAVRATLDQSMVGPALTPVI